MGAVVLLMGTVVAAVVVCDDETDNSWELGSAVVDARLVVWGSWEAVDWELVVGVVVDAGSVVVAGILPLCTRLQMLLKRI